MKPMPATLPKSVKRKPWLIDQLPWVGRGTSTALYPYVWLSGKTYDNLTGPHPDPYSVALLLHEQEHIARMKKAGPGRWIFRYLASGSFRFEEEVAAIRPQYGYLKREKLDAHMEFRAKRLSGWLYFWPVSYNQALKRLKRLWEDA